MAPLFCIYRTLHHRREPEARPSLMVSNAFTLLCLSPFLLMLILWAR